MYNTYAFYATVQVHLIRYHHFIRIYDDALFRFVRDAQPVVVPREIARQRESNPKHASTATTATTTSAHGCTIKSGKECFGKSSLFPTTTYQSLSFHPFRRMVRRRKALRSPSDLILSSTANVSPYSFWPLALSACAITQHIAVVSIFLVTFVHIYDTSWDPRILVWASIVVFLLGFLVWEGMQWFQHGFEPERRDSR